MKLIIDIPKYVYDLASKEDIIVDADIDKVVTALKDSKPYEEKTGYWEDDLENEVDSRYGRHLYKCSCCGAYAHDFVGGTEDWWDMTAPNFCPSCGAKMSHDKAVGNVVMLCRDTCGEQNQN